MLNLYGSFLKLDGVGCTITGSQMNALFLCIFDGLICAWLCGIGECLHPIRLLVHPSRKQTLISDTVNKSTADCATPIPFFVPTASAPVGASTLICTNWSLEFAAKFG